MVKNNPASAEDLGLIPGSERAPGEGNGNPLQYSCLEKSQGQEAWQAIIHGVAKESATTWQLNNNKIVTCSFQFFLNYLIYLTNTNQMFREGNGNPLQPSCLENAMEGGALWAAVHGVAKSQTRLSNFTFTFHFHALEKEMATHSSALAWRIPGTGEPGGLPSMASHRVEHD